MPPDPTSPRFQALLRALPELMRIVSESGVDFVLCGKVARGEDTEGSDIDLLCLNFPDLDNALGSKMAHALERAIKPLLAPFAVDVIGTPIMPVDPPYRQCMLRDAVPLVDLPDLL